MQKKRKLKAETKFVILGLAPILGLYLYLRALPIYQTFYLSFTSWDMVAKNKPFVGLANYLELFRNDMFLLSLKNTTIVAFGILALSVPTALFIANLLIKVLGDSKTKSLYEALYFLPVITPVVPVTIIWKWILDGNFGILNYVISLAGLPKLAWLLDPTLAILSVIVLTGWKVVGYNMLFFLVGLRGIAKEYYEAAAIDGASGFKAFRYITLPLLKPITVFVSVMTLINGYNVFSQIYILASDVQGAPGYVVRVLVYDMIENGFRYFRMGFASAEAVILFAIVFVLTVVQLGLGGEGSKKKAGAA